MHLSIIEDLFYQMIEQLNCSLHVQCRNYIALYIEIEQVAALDNKSTKTEFLTHSQFLNSEFIFIFLIRRLELIMEINSHEKKLMFHYARVGDRIFYIDNLNRICNLEVSKIFLTNESMRKK